MGEIWIRNPGAVEQYGPLTVVRLRRLTEAGLVQEQTLAHDGKCDWRVIAKWPELMAALEDPACETWVGAPVRPGVNRGERVFEVATEPVRPVFEGKSALRLGRAVAASEVDGEAAHEAFDVRSILAVNVACEPASLPPNPPWYSHPWARNAARWLAAAVPITLLYGVALASGFARFGEGMQVEDCVVFLLWFGLVFLWTYEVWVLSPCHWRMIDRKTGKAIKRGGMA